MTQESQFIEFERKETVACAASNDVDEYKMSIQKSCLDQISMSIREEELMGSIYQVENAPGSIFVRKNPSDNTKST